MRRSGRSSGRAFRVFICCTCEDNESEPSTAPSTAPAGPRPGQSSRLTPRTEVGLGEGLGGPVSRLPPGLQVRDDGSRRRSRALTQTGISEATLVAGSHRSDIELNETHSPAGLVTTAERHTSVSELPIISSRPVEGHPRPSSLTSPMRDARTQGAHQDSLAPSPGDHRMQDETQPRRRRSLYIESSQRAHDTRQQRRRSLAMDNLPAQESHLEAPGRAGGPANRRAPDEARQRRRRSSQMDSSRQLESPVTGPEGHSDAPHETKQSHRRSLQIDSSRRLESPVTGPEGHSGAPHETRQSHRRSLHIDSSPHRPELRQHRRRRYLQNPPHLSNPGEDSDLGRLAYPPLGVEHLFPESPSAVEPNEGGEGGASNAETRSDDVKKGKSSKEGAERGGSA